MLTPLTADVQQRLLGRTPRRVLAAADRRALAGERVLITGAGGSVGSELARQIAACAPARLVLLDHAEYALFHIEDELRRTCPGLSIDTVLGDVSRSADMRTVCVRTRPHVVYHAAAYKHVTMTEGAVVAAVRTNVLGTLETARAARAVGARFLLVSSDKAAEPRSVMGATKRLAELVALSLASPLFRPLAVRFGNILGSSGSVVEVMRRCILERRPIPITDPDATRFFMTAEEAVALVLKADLIGGRAEVFWLDMGQPVRIGDLAARLLAVLTPAGEPPVGLDVIGLRPGEKMNEELTTQGLAMRSTRHPRIWSARQRRIRQDDVAAAVRALRRAAANGRPADALVALQAAIPEFSPSAAAIDTAHTSQAAVHPPRPARRDRRRTAASA